MGEYKHRPPITFPTVRKDISLSAPTCHLLAVAMMENNFVKTLLSVATFEHGWPPGASYELVIEQVTLRPVEPKVAEAAPPASE